jgi:hypothetical protein
MSHPEGGNPRLILAIVVGVFTGFTKWWQNNVRFINEELLRGY